MDRIKRLEELAHAHVSAKHAAREASLAHARLLVRHAGNAIRAIHRHTAAPHVLLRCFCAQPFTSNRLLPLLTVAAEGGARMGRGPKVAWATRRSTTSVLAASPPTAVCVAGIIVIALGH